MNIYQKLIEVRKAVPYLKKDNTGHQFKYVSSSQTLGALREKMDELQLLLIPCVDEVEVRDHTDQKGNHHYFTILGMSYIWVNAENPEEQIKCRWIGQGLDSGEKGVGKAVTYSEKYFLLKFFNIATDKDDPDSFQEKISPGDKKNGKKVTQDYEFLGHVSEMKKKIDQDEYVEIKAIFKVDKSNEILPENMDQFLKELEKIVSRNERFQAVMAGFNKDVQGGDKLDEMNKILEPYGGYAGILTKADQKTIFEKVSKLIGKKE